jgi:hypothetical protein
LLGVSGIIENNIADIIGDEEEFQNNLTRKKRI